MAETFKIYDVGTLRRAVEALKDFPDDHPLHTQVVATNGQCFNLWLDLTPKVDHGNIGVFTASHPDLVSLVSRGDSVVCIPRNLHERHDEVHQKLLEVFAALNRTH